MFGVWWIARSAPDASTVAFTDDHVDRESDPPRGDRARTREPGRRHRPDPVAVGPVRSSARKTMARSAGSRR
jgi:hypothetical protein